MFEKRNQQFSRNDDLENLLAQINGDLEISELQILSKFLGKPMSYPLVLVMGPLRSGTTLFTQWLANTGLIAYPTNMLSRFYRAPIIGAKIQLLLTDPRFSFRNELGEFAQQAEYRSENGKTQGVLAPNEFWYFWRRFLAEPGRDAWSDDELRQSMDTKTLKAELIGMMDVFQKPFAAKGMLFNYNIPFLDSIFDKVLFVQMERDPVSNVASVLEARKRQFGREDTWYSFKIPEYELLKDLDPITQSAAQVQCINQAVTAGLAKVNPSRKLVIRYEEFCRQPVNTFNHLTEKLGMSDETYRGPGKFEPTPMCSIKKYEQISNAFERFKMRLGN